MIHLSMGGAFMNKKSMMIVLVFILCVVICAVLFSKTNREWGLIFTLFRPELQKASDDFYSEYLSDNPSVANDSGKIISFKKTGDGYSIKFGISPYLGAHNTVGYDEVEYVLNNSGTITLLNFSHKKNKNIPPRLGVTVKKPIPVS